MKASFLTIMHRFCIATFSLCCTLPLLLGPSARADQDPMSVEATLATPATLTLGEPIALHYKLSNLSCDEHLAVLTGIYNTQWYTLGLQDAQGRQVPAVPDTRPLDPPGLHAGDVNNFAVSASRDGWQDGYIVASKSFSVPRPGKYVLTLHVHAAYTLVAPTLENPVLMKSMIRSAETIYTQDFQFPLTVTAANPTRLQAKANALKEAIAKEQSSVLLLPEMDELFSMPEAQASSVWEEIALQAGPMNRDLIADHLANLHTSKAADILFKMLDNPAGSSSFVSEKLAETYNNGNPALREHIKSVAAQKGVQLPQQVVIPQVID